MKNLFSLVLAGIIGGLIVLGGIKFTQNTPAAVTESTELVSPVKLNKQKASKEAISFDFKEAAQIAMPAVVHISARATKASNDNNEIDDAFRFFFGDDLEFNNPFGRGPQKGTGSGVIYTSDGYIITNNHVIDFADEVEVTLYDNRKFIATVVGKDKKTDLAVLKLEANSLPVLKVGNSDHAEIGEWVLAVGNPFDLTSTVTAGIISAKGRNIELLGGNDAIESFIQTDAAVNPGNSGGALVDTDGKLLGINTAIASSTGLFSGYSFAIPVNLVTRIVDDIIEYGSFQRAFLGIEIVELDSEYASELGIDLSQGVVIQKLIDGGSAQFAGLLPKDVIIKVNNKEIRAVPELQEVVGTAKVGDILDVTINRKGQIKVVPVKLKAG